MLEKSPFFMVNARSRRGEECIFRIGKRFCFRQQTDNQMGGVACRGKTTIMGRKGQGSLSPRQLWCGTRCYMRSLFVPTEPPHQIFLFSLYKVLGGVGDFFQEAPHIVSFCFLLFPFITIPSKTSPYTRPDALPPPPAYRWRPKYRRRRRPRGRGQ